MAERHRLAGRRILVVDDHPLNQEILLGLLEGSGLLIELASDGQEAVERFRASPTDLILMDIQMPVMDGLEATHLIRAFDQQVPIIALTASTLPEEVAATKAAGMSAHLSKPIAVESLYGVLLESLAPQGAAAPSAMTARKVSSALSSTGDSLSNG